MGGPTTRAWQQSGGWPAPLKSYSFQWGGKGQSTRPPSFAAPESGHCATNGRHALLVLLLLLLLLPHSGVKPLRAAKQLLMSP